MPSNHKLRVFLCHASQDKSAVRDLYQRLKTESWLDPWLDEENILPGQDWNLEIEQAVETADAVIVFLSNNSVSKEGFIQRELRYVLDIALEKPEGTIFVVPIRLDNCQPPRPLRSWQYVDFFPRSRQEWAYSRLLESLRVRGGKPITPADHTGVKPIRKNLVPWWTWLVILFIVSGLIAAGIYFTNTPPPVTPTPTYTLEPTSAPNTPKPSPTNTSGPVIGATSTKRPTSTPKASSEILVASKTSIIQPRECPDLRCAKDKDYPRGTTCELSKQYADWFFAEFPDGKQGWVYIDWLDIPNDVSIDDLPKASYSDFPESIRKYFMK